MHFPLWRSILVCTCSHVVYIIQTWLEIISRDDGENPLGLGGRLLIARTGQAVSMTHPSFSPGAKNERDGDEQGMKSRRDRRWERGRGIGHIYYHNNTQELRGWGCSYYSRLMHWNQLSLTKMCNVLSIFSRLRFKDMNFWCSIRLAYGLIFWLFKALQGSY